MPGMDDRGPVQAELCGVVPGGRLMLCEGTVEAERTRGSLGALTVGEMHLHLTRGGAGKQSGGLTRGVRQADGPVSFLI